MLPVSARKRVKELNAYAAEARSRLEAEPQTTIDFKDSLNFLDKTQEEVGVVESSLQQ